MRSPSHRVAPAIGQALVPTRLRWSREFRFWLVARAEGFSTAGVRLSKGVPSRTPRWLSRATLTGEVPELSARLWRRSDRTC